MARSTKLVTATPIPIKLGQNRVNPSACWSEIAQTISSKPATIKRSHAILPSGTSSGLSGYAAIDRNGGARYRSEEHTSELQSLMRISYAVFCLKKKKKQIPNETIQST